MENSNKRKNKEVHNVTNGDQQPAGVLPVDKEEVETISSLVNGGGDPNLSPTYGKPLI